MTRIGSRSERVPVLIDTMASGTVITYEFNQSDSKTIQIETGEVTSLFSNLIYEGQLAKDKFCISDYYRD